MVQINLPKNSEVKKGKYFKDQTGSNNIRKVNVPTTSDIKLNNVPNIYFPFKF